MGSATSSTHAYEPETHEMMRFAMEYIAAIRAGTDLWWCARADVEQWHLPRSKDA